MDAGAFGFGFGFGLKASQPHATHHGREDAGTQDRAKTFLYMVVAEYWDLLGVAGKDLRRLQGLPHRILGCHRRTAMNFTNCHALTPRRAGRQAREGRWKLRRGPRSFCYPESGLAVTSLRFRDLFDCLSRSSWADRHENCACKRL